MKKWLAITALAALAVQSAVAQNAPAAPVDAQLKAQLDTMAAALMMTRGPNRVDAIAAIEYWATGTTHALGQAYRPDGEWPAFKTAYHATVNYHTPGMRIEMTRSNPDGNLQGGGGLPLAAPQKVIQVVSGRNAWNESQPGGGLVPGAGTATPAPAAVNDRLVQFWILPHAVVKAARLAGAQTKLAVDGGKVTLTYPLPNNLGMTAKATMNAKNLPEKVEIRMDNAVLGDHTFEVTYSDYGDRNDAMKTGKSDIPFPGRIVQKQGGHVVLDLTVTETDSNNPYVIMPVPENVEKAAAVPPAPVKVDAQKIGEGLYYLTGGTHHSVLVEFKDYVALMECPLNDERANAVLEAVKKTVPNKPLTYVINSHHHFDHSGGMRACAATGATILTQGANKAYYEKIWAQPHTIKPDTYAKAAKKPVIETVAEKKVLTDGTRTLELHHMQGSDHADTILMGYLPKEKVLIEVDSWNPPPPNAPAPTGPAPKEVVALYDNIQRLKLDVQQIAPLHGQMMPIAALRTAAGKPSTN